MTYVAAGSVNIDVQQDGASEDAPTLVGANHRMFDGSFRSTVQAAKRRWRFQTPPVDTATYATYAAAFLSGTIYSCSGPLLGATINCVVTIENVEYVKDGLLFLYIVTLVFDEA